MAEAADNHLGLDAAGIAARDFWLARLDRGLEPASLYPDFPRPRRGAPLDAGYEFELPPDLCGRIAAVTDGGPFLTFVTLLVGLQICLYKHTGHRLVCIGSPARRRAELPAGFHNAVCIAASVSGGMSSRDLLQQGRQVLLETYAHQAYPLAQVVADLGLDSTAVRCPLFAVTAALEELHGELPPAGREIDFRFARHGGGIHCSVRYASGLFAPCTIERFTRGFIRVLAAALADTTVTVRCLRILAPEEEEALAAASMGRPRRDEACCVHEWFERTAAQNPAAPAVEGAAASLTFAALEAQANRLGRYLRQRGVGPEKRVVVCLERSPDLAVAILGILKAGGGFVPVDPADAHARLAWVVNDVAPTAVLAQERLLAGVHTGTAPVVDVNAIRGELEGFDAGGLGTLAHPDNVAYVIYTSGSTGEPKGVVVSHRALVNYLSWGAQSYSMPAGAGTPLHSSIAFDLSITSLFLPLVLGRPVLMVPDAAGIDGLCDLLCDRRLGLLKLTPTHLRALATQLDSLDGPFRVASLVVGGESLRSQDLEFWRERAASAQVVNEYGPTEATVGCCAYELSAPVAVPGDVPIGRPIANVRLHVLDEDLEPVPAGAPGQLYVGGLGLARGYFGRPDCTAEAFVPDPFSRTPGQCLYATGDIARCLLDGTFEFIGRADTQVKVRGYRVELGEVEAALREHASVHTVVAVAPEDDSGTRQIVAYVVPEAPRRRISVPELERHLEARLPEFARPSRYVSLPSLPLTRSGKVDRRALPALSALGRDSETEFTAPRTPMEESLAAIWRELLHQDEIGVHDSFFELGGHSLLALRLLARIRAALQVNVPLKLLFEAPTIAGLAGDIETRRRGEAQPSTELGGPIVPVARRHEGETTGPPREHRSATRGEDARPRSEPGGEG